MQDFRLCLFLCLFLEVYSLKFKVSVGSKPILPFRRHVRIYGREE